MSCRQIALGQAGMGKARAQGLKRTRRSEGKRTELCFGKIELARDRFQLPEIQPLHFVPASYRTSEAIE